MNEFESLVPNGTFYEGISEPGYEDTPAIAANWNKCEEYFKKFSDKKKLLWDDEWSGCDDCNKAVRIQPDSYDWEPNFVTFLDGTLVCQKCITDLYDVYSDAILELYICNQNSTVYKLAPSWLYPFFELKGFTCLDQNNECRIFESGLHEGQSDSPEKVMAQIHSIYTNTVDIIFIGTAKSQFDLNWNTLLKVKEVENEDSN